MNTFVSSMAILAGLIAAVQAQSPEQAVAATAVASRLGQMVLDPISSQAVPDDYAPSHSRLGGMLLAQIPQQPTINPGQNPNTLPPGGGRPTMGGGIRPLSPQSARLPNNGSAPAGSSPRPQTPPPQPQALAQPHPVVADVATPDVGAGGDDELVPVTFQNVPMPQILLFYEQLTGKKVIRDINVEAVTFSIDTTGELPKKKAVEFIEKSLLLNGYGFLPAGDDFVKFINLAAIKPGAEHPFIMKEDDLPVNNEAIVTYIQPLRYLEADDLKKTLGDLVPLHTYGIVTPLPNSRGVAITENSNTIRYIIELLKTLDVEVSKTEKRSFQLQRASADDVAKSLADILDLESKGSSGSGSNGGRKNSSQPSAAPQPAQQPGQPAIVQNTPHTGVYGSGPQATAIPPKIIPIPRTNKLLVIARPTDLDYISTLIDELDSAAEIRSFITRPLKYLSANDILPIIKDAITRGLDEGGSGSGSGSGSIIGNNGSGSGSGSNNGNKTTGSFGSNNGGSGSNSLGGSGSFGSSGTGGSGSGGGSSFGGGSGLQALRQNSTPQSLVVGKTLLIADPTANEIYASGPPEHLRILQELLDELDKRPRSVMLSVVIGELKLDDNKDFGIDYIFNPKQVGGGNSTTNLAGGAQTRVGAASGFLDPNSVTSLADVTKAVSPGMQLFGTIHNQVNFAVSALAQTTDFKILSRPTLYTMNNMPASIETGLKIPVPVSSLSSLDTTGTTTGGVSNGFVSNIQYQDVSLRLDVSPLINSDDEITLQVKQVNEDVAGSTTLNGNSIPNISNQGLETTIMVRNNSTVLLGGLIQETHDKERSGIPILKDIPLIKYLASSNRDNLSRRELLVFIQPRIVTGNGDSPVTPQDASGASPLGDDAQKFLRQEHSDPAADTKTVRRSKFSQLLHKLVE